MLNKVKSFINTHRATLSGLPIQQQAGADMVLVALEDLISEDITPEPTETSGNWVSIKDAAKATGLHEQTIRSWAWAGKLTSRQPGGRKGRIWVFVPEDMNFNGQ